MELRTKIVSGVIRSLKLPPRFRLKIVKEDPVRLELSLTPSYGKNPVIVGIVESLDLVARRDREGKCRESYTVLGIGQSDMGK